MTSGRTKRRRLTVAVAFLSALALAQPAPRFSSAYTDLNTQCRQDGNPNEQPGSDLPLTCKGYGGYTLNVSYSAFAASLYAQKGTQSVYLAEVEGDYDAQKNRKLEWRMANNAPFAVILRVNTYRPAPDGGDPFQAKNKTGTLLRVVGLAGFEGIKGEVDAKTLNANEKARALADAGYRKYKK